MNFKKGQPIVCIESSQEGFTHRVLKDKTYHFDSYFYCSHCGSKKLTLIEFPPFSNESGQIYKTPCKDCKGMIYSQENIWRIDRFRPLQEKSAESEEFSENLIKELELEINEENLIPVERSKIQCEPIEFPDLKPCREY